MSFHAELVLAVETLDRLVVQEFHWGLVQLTNERNVPLGGMLTGQIRVVLDRLHHPVLAAWMADSYKKLDGKLIAYGLDGMSITRIIEFEEGYCSNQGMYFDGTKSNFATGLSLLISAQTLRIDGVAVLTNKSQL
ncbi:MAG: hypothetical protein EOO55_02805 [Hymenobacter sp.]|nr:MAG: hypothetical protein EOO55_02805 [Hymenobacter sp.]